MQTDIVTGAFGYSGAAIARELRAAGHRVRTLTGHPERAPAGTDIDAHPLDFGDADGLARDMTGSHTLYCTYWVRFPHGSATRESAVANSKVLFDAAARAGIKRIVCVSILHADTTSPYPYQAMGVLRAARRLGIDVPAQLSVIGYDNLPVAAWTDPPLARELTRSSGLDCAFDTVRGWAERCGAPGWAERRGVRGAGVGGAARGAGRGGGRSGAGCGAPGWAGQGRGGRATVVMSPGVSRRRGRRRQERHRQHG